MLLRDMKQPQQRGRVLLEIILRRDGHPSAIENKTIENALAAAPPQPRAKPPAPLLIDFEDGAKDAGQVTDILRDEEIVLHKALDAATAGAVAVVHALADFGLQREGQALLGATREVMKVTPHRP